MTRVAPVERHGERRRRVERNAQLARQAVARAARDDGQRRVAEGQRRRHLVDGAVAAPGDHQR